MNKLKNFIIGQKRKAIGLGMAAALLVCALAPTLTAKASWIYNDAGWWWSEENGYPVNEWRYINGEWYWFDATGYMATGWRNVGGTWYYMDASGAMATGWRNVGGTWYYMDAGGAMATGWRNVGGTWYYMDASGAMATGWRNVGGTWYYMDASGAMATGWRNVGGTWYYMDAGGAMATGWRNVGGTWYYMDASGAMATGWQNIDGTYYYMYDNGAMASNTWIGNYYVNENGKFDEASKENSTNSGTQTHTHDWQPNYHMVNHPTTETYLISDEVPSQWVSTGKIPHYVCSSCGYDTTDVNDMSKHKFENLDQGLFCNGNNTGYSVDTGYWTDPIPAQYGTRQVDNWVYEPDGTYTCSICGATK